MTQSNIMTGQDEEFRVALVCMPFYGGGRPSIQLGLLQAVLEQAGFATDTYHLNLDLAAQLTPAIYEVLCTNRGRMTGDWLFAVAAFGESACRSDVDYFNEFPQETAAITRAIGKDTAYLAELRRSVLPAFVERCVDAVEWSRYRVVGFSSTFQQNVASLALAARIKERHPTIQVVFGGSNMDGEMGPATVQAFPWIDYAVIGEGEVSFPALLQALAAGQPPPAVPGIVGSGLQLVDAATPSPSPPDMNQLPVPRYSEYFDRAAQHGLLYHPDYRPWIMPFESSRGCWWGQKHHCTFCGLNGTGMTYRAKDPARVMVELGELARRHRCTFFAASDNIMDLAYVTKLFDHLAETRMDYQFFYEVKANLTAEQIRRLYRGGMRRIQPGIESMSSHVLRLMRKGCTMLQNVRLLKWCRYYDIGVSWNLLWGFPGETAEDYARELAVLQQLSHLEPPNASGRIWLERFAPYFADRERFPVSSVRPDASYHHIYPSQVDLERIAYFFEYTMGDTLPDAAHDATVSWVQEWQRRWQDGPRDTLYFRRTPDCLFIDDARGDIHHGTYTFEGPLAAAYEYCSESMHSVAAVTTHLHERFGRDVATEQAVRDALDEFCARGLMVGEDDNYLALALPTNPNW